MYRGQRIDNGEWVYGFYYANHTNHYILMSTVLWHVLDAIEIAGSHIHAVHPESVGQWTGLKDRSGVKIYEGDIITHTEKSPYGGWWDGIVTWKLEGDIGWCVEPLSSDKKAHNRYAMNYAFMLGIIGNTTDNENLIK